MHELSIACSIVETVEENLPTERAKATKINLKIGKLSGVVKDALLFSFEIAAEGTRVEGAQIEIEELPVLVFCRKCGESSELGSPPIFRCLICSESTAELIQGKEMEIVSIEFDDGEPTHS